MGKINTRQLREQISKSLPLNTFYGKGEITYSLTYGIAIAENTKMNKADGFEFYASFLDFDIWKTFSFDSSMVDSQENENIRNMHNHDFFELMIMKSGSLKMNIDGRLYVLNKGDCCLLNCNTHHMEYTEKSYSVDFIWISRNYINKPDQDFQIYNEKSQTSIITRFFTGNRYDMAEYHKDFLLFTAEKEGFEQLTEILEHIKKELKGRKSGYQMIVRGYLRRIFSLLGSSRYYNGQYINLDKDKDKNLFHDVRLYIVKKKARVTGHELEEVFNYNYDYIAKVFKKTCGISPIEFNTDTLLETASQEILRKDSSIVDITHELGFENRAHFNRMFKKKFGLSPSEYKKSHLEE